MSLLLDTGFLYALLIAQNRITSGCLRSLERFMKQ